jgi:hypothetical protein
MNAETKIVAPSISAAMAKAFAEIEAATKSANNPHFKSKYADLGAVIEAIKPALINHGLFFTQHCHPAEDGVCVETVLGHESGEERSLGKLFVPANKKDAQGFGSALTYARRYGLMTAFGVPAEDDDGNAAAASAPRAAPVRAAMSSDEQRDMIQTLSSAAGKTLQQICAAYKVQSLKDLTGSQAEAVLARLQTAVKPEAQATAKEPVNA